MEQLAEFLLQRGKPGSGHIILGLRGQGIGFSNLAILAIAFLGEGFAHGNRT
jgi:hypothetical protein